MNNIPPKDSSLSMDNFSLPALQTAEWYQLERFTIEVLKSYYEPFGLKISRTEKRSAGDIGGDGAHDGEATYVFAASPEEALNSSTPDSMVGPDLGVLITLWVEVKQRSRNNVNHHDLGGTIFRSSLEYVTKIIFVSNRSFTKPFKEDLARYALRNGMQFALIDGQNLIRIAEEVSKKSNGQKAAPSDEGRSQVECWISTRLHFALDPLLRYSDISTSRVERAIGEPIFIVADCKIDALIKPSPNLRVELRYLEQLPLTITPRSGNIQYAVGAGDRFRAEFIVFPEHPCELFLDRFELHIFDEDNRDIDCKISREHETCSVRGTILPGWIPPSRIESHHGLSAAIESWVQSGGSKAADVLAIAGAGKSHFVRESRPLWLRLGAYEIFLDGGNEQRANAAALALLGQLFPIPMDEVTSELSSILAEWLTRSGIPKRSATALARSVCNPSKDGELPFSDEQLGHFLALVLAKRSEHRPIILVFEDLHKCYPSLIALLKAIRQSLVRLGRGKVFTLFTTREDSVWNEEAVRNDWRASMEIMRMGSDAIQFRLGGFVRDEALALIKGAIPAIEDHYAEAIIDQVGTTPFGIREALGLLLERRALEAGEQNGVWKLIKPDVLISSLDNQDLRQATHYRLKGLRERHPKWLADFLDSGACLGQSFDLEVCAKSAGKPKQADLEKALTECRLLEVLRFSLFSSSKLQFDHDLIRLVLLQDIGPFRQRRLAKSLLKLLKDQESPNVLSSLAYQAGLGDECWSYALKQVDIASKAMRHMEAVHALGLALTVTDHNAVTKVFDVQQGRYRPSFDEAIAVAEPCTRSNLDRESRERETADLLLQYIEHLVAVGSAGTPSVDKALTEGEMLAERLQDKTLRATLKMYHGRQEFNRDRPVESLRLHQEAESMFATVEPTKEVSRLRVNNLVRMAIALRSDGQLEESRRTLVKAMRERRGRNWPFAIQARANFGATFFYIDWNKTRHHWQRAVQIAERHNLVDRYVHGLIDVAFLDLLEERMTAAEQALEKALALSRDYGLENSELRCLLNLGCFALMSGNPRQALELLREADRLGFRHGIGRRLWRVRANMATAYFILGDTDRSVATDQITLNSMPSLEGESSLLDAKRFFSGTRLILALANITLRAETSDKHQNLLRTLPTPIQESARELARAVLEDQLESLPGLRGRHCKSLSGQRFFIITE
jgi:tetratricopeptide (TPR) repeat protein